jgi:hypothetical protein
MSLSKWRRRRNAILAVERFILAKKRHPRRPGSRQRGRCS